MDNNYNQMSRRQYINKRKRRRRALMLRFFAVLAVLIATAGLIIGIILLIKGHSFSGTFTRKADVSDKICGDIALFLSDIDNPDIDSEWVKNRVEPYIVTEVIALSPEGSAKDSYSRFIDPDSYALLNDKVNSDLDKLLNEIIKDKLIEKGYKEDMSDEETASLVNTVLGMSTSDYLVSNGISLLPPLDELSLSIIGSKEVQNGTYKIHGNSMDIEINGNKQTESIIKKKGTLVFTAGGKVYNEEQK